MADYDFTADELAAADRIPRYNERPFNADATSPAYNPWGFDNGGYLTLQMKQARDTMLMGVAARRFANSASSSAILAAQEAASAKAARQAAQNAATDAYNSAQAAAGKVALAGAEADRAKAQADLAKGYAAGVKLPVIDASMVDRFLKVGLDASGNAVYELGEITIATAAQINTGTGTGFANAQTLGPILKGIRDSADLAASKLPPIGSYILWPQFAKSDPGPGPNWIEPKGQIVPLSSYPKLADVLPAYPVATGRGNPAYNPTGTFAAGGNVQGLALEGTRFVAMVSGALFYSDTATGKSFTSTVGFTSLRYDTLGSYGTPSRPILRDNEEVVFFDADASHVRSIGLSSKATADAGVNNPTVMIQDAKGSTSSYQGMYKLPNGTLIVINYATNASYGDFYRFWKLPAGAAVSNGFQAFDPIVSGNMGQNNPNVVRHWQTKNGTVYVACRPRGSTGAHTIYRTTDGSSWTAVGTFNLQSASYVIEGVPSPRPNQGRRELNNLEESPDGQQILVGLQYGYLVSVNGGAGWVFKTRSQLINVAAPYSMLTGVGDSPNWLSITWDKTRSQWVAFGLVNKTGVPNNVLVILAGPTLNSLSVIGDVSVSVNANGGSMTQFAIHVTVNTIYVWFTVSGSIYWSLSFPYAAIPSSANNRGSSVGLNFVARLEGLPFDGVVFESQGNYQAWWLQNDDSPIIDPSDGVSSSYANTDFNVSPDKTRVVNICYSNAYQMWSGAPFDINPALERKLPNVSLPNISGAFPFTEQFRSRPTSPRVLMRVN